MSYYVEPFTFDFAASLIQVDDGEAFVDVDALYDAIKEAQASEEGVLYGRVASGSGLVQLGEGVLVGLTVELLGDWQLRFAEGAYIAKVSGGNLVGGPAGDPIAYSAGVQTLLMQSAAATAVMTGGGSAPTAAQNAAAVWQRALEAGVTAEQMLRVLLAGITGRTTGVGTSNEQYKSIDGNKTRIDATFDAQGNRLNVDLDGTP